jgi:hypothetical protein
MSFEVLFRPGMRVESALEEFRDQISRRETISSTEKRAVRKLLLRLQPLLADPITADQAQALDDALHGRHRTEDLIEWLQSPPMPWGHFPAYQREQEEVKREQLWRQWKSFEDLWGDKPDKPALCPSCGSRSVVRIAYGLPDEVGKEAARRGAIALGGCILGKDAPKCHCWDCSHRWGKLLGDEELLDGNV